MSLNSVSLDRYGFSRLLYRKAISSKVGFQSVVVERGFVRTHPQEASLDVTVLPKGTLGSVARAG